MAWHSRSNSRSANTAHSTSLSRSPFDGSPGYWVELAVHRPRASVST